MRSLLLLLAGCPAVFDGQYDENVRDLDGDGAISDRFGGPDCRDQDPTITACDADGDGERSVAAGGTDCDDTDATVFPGAPERCNRIDDDCDGAIDNQDDDVQGDLRWWVDTDGDGAGDPGQGRICQEFADPTNPATALHVANDDDCDDLDPSIGPDADEICDGIDNDCDGVIDDAGVWLRDDDQDGYGVDGTQVVGPCTLGPDDAVAAVGGDCDDDDASIAPGATEVPYDGVDSNCNGGLDDWDADFDGHVPSAHWAQAQAANALLPVAQRWTIAQGDCDDTDPRVYVGAEEVCDGVDNDCDGAVDVADLANAGPTDELALRAQIGTWYLDEDGDGAFGTEVLLCPDAVLAGVHSATSDDCYDSGPAPVGFAGADPADVREGVDETCDGFDNDCDGLVDHGLDPFPGSIPLFVDSDGDGIGSTERYGCAADPSYALVEEGGDCNDAAANVFPGAPEICGDAIRQDCSTAHIFDCDGDGFQGSYLGGGDGSDCEDERVAVNPDATVELCDGVDNDCDGLLDSADLDDLDAGPQPFWYPDADGDGFGIDDGTGIQQCDQPADRSIVLGDCDDTDPGLSPETVWYADQDGDGYGSTVQYQQCVPPVGVPTVLVGGDCDDTADDVFPGATWSLDQDGDGAGAIGSEQPYCEPPAGEPWVLGTGVDCDDADPLRSPGLPEIAGDSIDNDCDGVVDGGASTLWYVDADGDGFGDENDPGTGTWSAGRVPNARDCDDTAAGVNPSAQVELCDGVDNNCDGFTIDGDPDVSNPWQGIIVPDDGGTTQLASYNGTDFSLGLLVTTCAPTAATDLVTPLGVEPLFPLAGIENPAPYLTCPDGVSSGQLYLRDADGDGVPALESAADIALDCGEGHPAGFAAYAGGDTDCDPFDPDLRYEIEDGMYGDVDRDGFFAGWSEPGVCAWDVSGSRGDDCDDHDPSNTTRNAGEVLVRVGVDLDDAVLGCDQAILRVQGENTVNAAILAGLPSGTSLTIRGDQPDTRVTVFAGNTTAIQMELGFDQVELNLLNTLLMEGPLVVRDSHLIDGGIELTSQGALIEDSLWDGGTVDPLIKVSTGTQVTMRDSQVRSADGLASIAQGRLDLIGVDLEGIGSGIELQDDGRLVVEDTRFENVQNPVAVLSGTASLTDIEITADGENPAPTFRVQSGSLTCDRCDAALGATTGSLFRATGGTLTLVDSHLETLGHDTTGVVEVTGGAASIQGSSIETQAGYAVLNLGGTATVRDAALKVTGAGAAATSKTAAVHTVLHGVEAYAPPSGDAIRIWAGTANLEDIVLNGAGNGVDIDVGGTTVPIDGLEVVQADGYGLSVANTRVVVDRLIWRDPTPAGNTAVRVLAGADVTLDRASFEQGPASAADVVSNGRLAIRDSLVRSGGTALVLDGGTETAQLSIVDSRVFVDGFAQALVAEDALVSVEGSLLSAPAAGAGAALFGNSVASFERVTVLGQANQPQITVNDDGETVFFGSHVLLQPVTSSSPILCNGTYTVSFTDSLFPSDSPGCGITLSPFDGTYGPTSYDGSLGPDGIATDPFVRTWFGELALDQPVP